MRARIGVICLVVAVLAALAAFTLGPQPFDRYGWFGFIVVAIRRALPGDWALIAGPGEFLANLLLFVPLGLVLVVLLGVRRWWLAVLMCIATTFTIESIQGAMPDRVADLSDILANSVGGAVGAAIGVLVSRRRAARARRVRATRR